MKTSRHRTNTKKKDVLFYHRRLECKSRKTKDTWNDRQVWPWNTKWSRAKANSFIKKHTVIANTFQQHERWLYTWTSPFDQHQNQIDYILCSQRWRSSIQSTKTRPGADCGSEHELLIAKFRLNWRNQGKLWGFPDGSVVKNLPANVRDAGPIPGSGRSPGVGNDNPFQYSCLENSMDRGAWQVPVHGVIKSQTWLSTHTLIQRKNYWAIQVWPK